ncbi:MAG: hypothetical protein ACXWUN_02275 [Allosphingosinicella sp.]
MRVEKACEAIAKGCCLELYYKGHSQVVEPHAAGYDLSGGPALLAWEAVDSAKGDRGAWLFVPLDDLREIDVSGYFSEAPRPGFVRDDPRFARILCQL